MAESLSPVTNTNLTCILCKWFVTKSRNADEQIYIESPSDKRLNSCETTFLILDRRNVLFDLHDFIKPLEFT